MFLYYIIVLLNDDFSRILLCLLLLKVVTSPHSLRNVVSAEEFGQPRKFVRSVKVKAAYSLMWVEIRRASAPEKFYERLFSTAF